MSHVFARTLRNAALAVIVAMPVARLGAQNPAQPVFAACPSPRDVFTARQVQIQAKPIADSAVSPRPIVVRDPASAAIAFTVDTLGVAEAGSLVRLSKSDTLSWAAVQATYRSWRFRPAVASGCKVRQRVLAAIGK